MRLSKLSRPGTIVKVVRAEREQQNVGIGTPISQSRMERVTIFSFASPRAQE